MHVCMVRGHQARTVFQDVKKVWVGEGPEEGWEKRFFSRESLSLSTAGAFILAPLCPASDCPSELIGTASTPSEVGAAGIHHGGLAKQAVSGGT